MNNKPACSLARLWLHVWVESDGEIKERSHRVCVVCGKHQVQTSVFYDKWQDYSVWQRGQAMIKAAMGDVT